MLVSGFLSKATTTNSSIIKKVVLQYNTIQSPLTETAVIAIGKKL